MARTFGDFASSMRELADKLPVRVNAAKVRIASTIHTDLLQTTPVDTGEAMCNWIIAANDAVIATRAAFAPSPRGFVSRAGGNRVWTHRVDPESTRQANMTQAREQAQQELSSIQPGDSIHITNSVRQIIPLDQGSPTQPGKFFADRAITLAEGVGERVTLLRD